MVVDLMMTTVSVTIVVLTGRVIVMVSMLVINMGWNDSVGKDGDVGHSDGFSASNNHGNSDLVLVLVITMVDDDRVHSMQTPCQRYVNIHYTYY